MELTRTYQIEGSGISVPEWVDDEGQMGPGTVTVTLSLSADAVQRGDDFVEAVREALLHESIERRVRELGALVEMLGTRVLYVPEVHEFMNSLVREGCIEAIDRILGDVKRRGRPRENHLYVVALTLHVAKVQGKSIADAAEWVATKYRKYCKSARAIENDVSRYAHLLEIYNGSRAFRPGLQTTRAWTRPEGLRLSAT